MQKMEAFSQKIAKVVFCQKVKKKIKNSNFADLLMDYIKKHLHSSEMY